MTRRAALTAVLLLAPAAARGQPAAPDPAVLRGESAQTRKRLAEAEAKLLAGNAADAADALQRVLDEAGDDLITTDNKQYRPARWVAQQILAKLPPDALKGYRARIDGPASKLLETGKQTRDVRPLWQLLDRYFVSGPADEGSLLLGDLLFERGEFRAAGVVWRRLLPDADADIPYPNPQTDPAAVRARLVLAAAFRGEPELARKEYALLRERHPTAAGRLAGVTKPYVEAVKPYLDRPPRFASGAADRGWPGFGGGPGRSGRAAGRMPGYWPGRPTWAKEFLEPDERRFGGGTAVPLGHPVILGGRVYVSDGVRVRGFDLRTGARSTLHEPKEKDQPGIPAASLTTADGRLFARLGGRPAQAPTTGRPGVAAKAAAAAKTSDTELVCFAPVVPGGPPSVLDWRLKPPAVDGKMVGVWEGAPLVANGRLWAAVARTDAGRVTHAVACYDPADAPDRPAWLVDVSDGTPRDGTRQELLTLAGRNVVFCTNTGAVVALDAVTGRRAWAFRYPRANRTSNEPSPAVYDGGRVFIAPADGDRVFALDAETGRLLWETGPTEAAQILGVTRNRVVVAVAGPVRGIRGLNAATGSHREPDGWVQHNSGIPLGFGRGFVTDDFVVWPTRDGLFVLNPDDGRPVTAPLRNLTGDDPPGLFGNVAYADGVLVVVTPTSVRGYVSDVKPPADPPDPDRRRFDRLADATERAVSDGDLSSARRLLHEAAAGDLPPRFRAWAAARLLLLTPPTDDPAKLPADVQSVLTPELRGEWVTPPAGGPVTLEELIDRRTGRKPPASRPSHEPPFEPAAPVLTNAAQITDTFRLPAGSVPLRPIPGGGRPAHVFVSAGPDLLAVPFAPAASLTRRGRDGFTHAAELSRGFVAAGPFLVAVYEAGNDPVWVFRVPDTDPLPDRPGRLRVRFDRPSAVPALSSFVLAGGWLFARLGDRHLIALDLPGRRVGWVVGTSGRPRFDPHPFPSDPRFGPHVFASGKMLIAQLSDGRRWTIRADTGKVLTGRAHETARVVWPQPPAAVGAGVAVADGPGLIRVIDLADGLPLWEYDAGGEASLTGEPPQARAWGDAVFVAVRRNHGVEVDSLDPATGRTGWACGPAFLDADRTDLSAADADDRHVYLSARDRLIALDRATGKTAWETELPEAHGAGGWTVVAGKKVLIAYPTTAVPGEPFPDVLDRVISSFARRPLGWRLPGLAATVYDAWAVRTVPVLLLDPETGDVLRTIEVPTRGPAVVAGTGRDQVVVVTADRVVWIK
jgi:outer membrane protein assembly factor BamB